ncbi:MAG: TraB domain-containing protein [Candidatus Thorarchaeota archaeon]
MRSPDDLQRVLFVGVIHTDSESVVKVRETVRLHRPDVVAVELDRYRLDQLLSRDATQTAVSTGQSTDGVQTLLQQIAVLEDLIGNATGSQVGGEMLAAIEEGRKIGAKIALVDRPLHVTVQALDKVPLDEIYRLMEMIPSVTREISGGNVLEMTRDLTNEENLEKLLSEFRRQFPGLTNVLIDQRDDYVARAISRILEDVQGKVVVVIGAGHLAGVRAALERIAAAGG